MYAGALPPASGPMAHTPGGSVVRTAQPITFSDFCQVVDMQFLTHIRRGTSISVCDFAPSCLPQDLSKALELLSVTSECALLMTLLLGEGAWYGQLCRQPPSSPCQAAPCWRLKVSWSTVNQLLFVTQTHRLLCLMLDPVDHICSVANCNAQLCCLACLVVQAVRCLCCRRPCMMFQCCG